MAKKACERACCGECFERQLGGKRAEFTCIPSSLDWNAAIDCLSHMAKNANISNNEGILFCSGTPNLIVCVQSISQNFTTIN